MLEIYIREPAYSNLLNGYKKYELRLLKGIFKDLEIGQAVLICNKATNKKIKRTVNRLLIYKSFKELLINLNIKNCLINYTDINNGLDHMSNIYTLDIQNKYDCVALEFI